METCMGWLGILARDALFTNGFIHKLHVYTYERIIWSFFRSKIVRLWNDDQLITIDVLNPDMEWRWQHDLRVTNRHQESRRQIKYTQLKQLWVELTREYSFEHPNDVEALVEDVHWQYRL